MIRQILTAVALVATSVPNAFAGSGSSEFVASIRATGSILQGSGVSSAGKTGTGSYEVFFPRAINTCYYFVSPVSGSARKAVANVTSAAPDTMVVKTFLNASTAQDTAFNVLVRCQD